MVDLLDFGLLGWIVGRHLIGPLLCETLKINTQCASATAASRPIKSYQQGLLAQYDW